MRFFALIFWWPFPPPPDCASLALWYLALSAPFVLRFLRLVVLFALGLWHFPPPVVLLWHLLWLLLPLFGFLCAS